MTPADADAEMREACLRAMRMADNKLAMFPCYSAMLDAALAELRRRGAWLPGDPPSASERTLREMVAVAHSGGRLYLDDGEMQDSTAHPPIDFLRDPVDVIADKMGQRTIAALAARKS